MKNFIVALALVFFCSTAHAYKFVERQVVTNGDMSQATINSIGMDISQTTLAAYQIVAAGAPVGVLKLQVSSDIVSVCLNDPDPACNVTTWVDVGGGTLAVSAAGNQGINYSNIGFRWLRLVYTKTSGTGTMNAIFDSKGMY